MFTFIELQGFSKRRQLLLPDDEFRAFQELLIQDPTAGDIIAGTGSFRKIRWNRSGMGKRGGIRIIYYNVTRNGRIYQAFLHPFRCVPFLLRWQEDQQIIHLSSVFNVSVGISTMVEFVELQH